MASFLSKERTEARAKKLNAKKNSPKTKPLISRFIDKVKDKSAKAKVSQAASKKKTAVKGTMQGKQVDTTKGPNYNIKKTTASQKSTAPKTSIVNKATTGMVSEKTGPDMSRGVPKRGSVAQGAQTYNQGSSMMKSSPATNKRMEDTATAKKKVQKRRGPSGPTMTGFK